MNYTNWAEIQQNPYPNFEFPVLHAPNQSFGYSQNLVSDSYQPSNVASHSAFYLPPQTRPPGFDPPYVPAAAAVNYAQPPQAVNYVLQPGFEAQHGAAAAAYYPDPNVSWVAATIPQFEANPYAAGVTTPNPAIQPQRRDTWKKAPKKTKIVQSAWCEVCKVDCNSKCVLDQHKLGRKHLKNLQNLRATAPIISAPVVAASISAITVNPPTSIAVPPSPIAVTSTSLSIPTPAPALAPVPPSVSRGEPVIGPQENRVISKKPKSQKSQKKAAARTEDLETKRRKVLEGGAAVDSVRACNICNVVCNSDTVFNYHLAGQKHASMAKKHALRAGVAASAM